MKLTSDYEIERFRHHFLVGGIGPFGCWGGVAAVRLGFESRQAVLVGLGLSTLCFPSLHCRGNQGDLEN